MSKNLKKSENLKKSQKISKNRFLFENLKFLKKTNFCGERKEKIPFNNSAIRSQASHEMESK